jgi:myo-inositol catabolism protein IolC
VASLGHAAPLYLLAFDHRGVFARTVLDATGEPTPEQEVAMVDAKRLIFEGVRAAAAAPGAVAAGQAGVLVDELYGAQVARDAKAAGIVLVMPVEAPDRELFDFAYGADWRAHVEAFDPDFAKVLVRYNAGGDAEGNARQAARLRELSTWLRAEGRKLLFELIVAPTAAQSAAAGGDASRFEREQRPALILRAMAELQAAGVEPDVWKLEGIDAPADAEAVVAQARTGAGREHVACTILGAGADDARVDHWLRTAAAIDGFAGFAIGRSIWRDAVRAHLAETLDRGAAARQIADNYLRFVAVFAGAARRRTAPASEEDGSGPAPRRVAD